MNAKLCQDRTFSALPGLRRTLKVLKRIRNLISSPPSFDHHILTFTLILIHISFHIRILNPYRQLSPLFTLPHRLHPY
jgi:hypothetical protein